MVELFILTGPSGSGVTSSRFVFEELGYYIVDNAPGEVTKNILDAFVSKQVQGKGLCLLPNIMDAEEVLNVAKNDSRYKTKFILLDTKKDELIKRYALSRHDHPRAILSKMNLEKAIELDCKEAERLGSLADIYIDTTNLTSKELRTSLYARVKHQKTNHVTKVTFMSFGFKNGTPLGLDEIVDVRILPNPYWVPELAVLNGEDKAVIDYIESFDVTHKYLEHLVNYLDFILDEVQKSQRASYTIGIACSGGKHRSTYVANYLAKHFADKYQVAVVHRDSTELNHNDLQ